MSLSSMLGVGRRRRTPQGVVQATDSIPLVSIRRQRNSMPAVLRRVAIIYIEQADQPPAVLAVDAQLDLLRFATEVMNHNDSITSPRVAQREHAAQAGRQRLPFA